ncbi:MAG: lactate dehydrogenase [Eubacterium sp.]|nr:lactate dehydrogenase [Candidatus Colimonas fimequi]
MRYISELIDKNREVNMLEHSFVFPAVCPVTESISTVPAKSARVNLVALGDVGGTVLMGLRLMGADVIDTIGIFDLNDAQMRRYEREINQISYPDGRKLPWIEILKSEDMWDCDMFVFCATKGVPPIGAGGDVRMAQLEANKGLVSMYAKQAVEAGYKGIFAVVSDPVDPLAKAALDAGLEPSLVRGYGLGVMNGRASYFAQKEERFARYLAEGRAFGPHGEDLVIADSIEEYDDDNSLALTELTVRSNLETRADGFKPYIAPAMSSGALSLIETLRGGWHYSSLYLGADGAGAFLGCRNRRVNGGNEVENLPLDEKLFQRIEKAYRNLERL